MTDRPTVSDLFLETLLAQGIQVVFANLGTDYPSIVEAMARRERDGLPNPRMVICPHENTAITAAHGYALATGKGQGVFVHVGVGTQNLGCGMANVMAGRVPVFIFAGRAPVTTRGERLGSRDNPIHYFQDVRDQAGILRDYCKWEFNLELPEQITYAVNRGARIMQSNPPGAVYMTAAREVLAMPAPERGADPPELSAVPSLGELSATRAGEIAGRILRAERPLLVTSYSGMRPGAVAALVEFSETLGVPVMETVPLVLNFPRDHPHHWGYRPGAPVAEADLILLVDTDVPWIPKQVMPKADTPVIQIDSDPVKPNITMWDFPVTESHQVDSLSAIRAILAAARSSLQSNGGLPGGELNRQRSEWLRAHCPPPPAPEAEGRLTPESISAVLGRVLPPQAVFFNEAVSNIVPAMQGMRQNQAGTYFGLPGGGLGWGGGAALGYKMARPEAEVVCALGDGAFLFTVPSSLFLTAQRYGAPFLTIIYNNGGWNAVKLATTRVYGDNPIAAQFGGFRNELPGKEELDKIAAACGCHTARVETAEQLAEAVTAGLEAVRGGRCSVVNALMEQT